MFCDLCLINTGLHTVTQKQQRCSNMSKGLLDAVVFKILPLYRLNVGICQKTKSNVYK